MQILIADDDPTALLLLQSAIKSWGNYEVLTVRNGADAWKVLQRPDPPAFALLDWMMPGIDGVEICRRARRTPHLRGLYLILLTCQEGREPRLVGLRAGANDYLTKPFDPAELEARFRVATLVVQLQAQLTARVRELENALAQIDRLERLLPICMYCKKIRDATNHWQNIESYITDHSKSEFSHGICADCYQTFCEPQLLALEDSVV